MRDVRLLADAFDPGALVEQFTFLQQPNIAGRQLMPSITAWII
jgi:hypothetical protein